MWNTPEGPLTLRGSFAQLIRGAIAELVDGLGQDDSDASFHETGVAMFDNLSRSARLALLARVGGALLRDETPPPAKLAVNDATVAAIFGELTKLIVPDAVELDAEWRRLLIDAHRQVGSERVLTLEDQDAETWIEAVEMLRDGILEDLDYLLDDTANRLPETSTTFRQLADIPEDYFAEPAPEPNDEEVSEIVAELCELAGTIEGDHVPIWMHDRRQSMVSPRRRAEVQPGAWVEHVRGDVVLQGRLIVGTSQLAIFRVERVVPVARPASRRKQHKQWRQGDHVSAPWQELCVRPRPSNDVLAQTGS